MEIIGTDITSNLAIFFKQLAKTLSFTEFEKFLKQYKKMENREISKHPVNGLSFQELGFYVSLVKDTNTFWLKDTIFNFGMGILVPQEWDVVYEVCLKMKENSTFKNCKKQIDILLQKICILKTNQYRYPHEQPNVKKFRR